MKLSHHPFNFFANLYFSTVRLYTARIHLLTGLIFHQNLLALTLQGE